MKWWIAVTIGLASLLAGYWWLRKRDLYVSQEYRETELWKKGEES